MSLLQRINTGTVPNDGTGDNLLAAFQKLNANLAYIEALLLSSPLTPMFAVDGTGNKYSVSVVVTGVDDQGQPTTALSVNRI